MKLTWMAAALCASLAVPAVVQAHDGPAARRAQHVNVQHDRWGHSVDALQREQHRRIAAGLRSGQLTRPEADRLLREQRSIRDQERRYLADGRLTRAERADLHAELNQASRHIYRETRDHQRRR